MSGDQAPGQQPAPTLSEMNGRIRELERQRNEALTRCANLSGVNALLLEALASARQEVERLTAPAPPDQPAAQALTLIQ